MRCARTFFLSWCGGARLACLKAFYYLFSRDDGSAQWFLLTSAGNCFYTHLDEYRKNKNKSAE